VITAGIGFLCIIPLLCAMVPLIWIIALILEQAQPAIVLEDLGMLDGFKQGWQIVKSNVGPMIVMALILGVGSLIIGVIVALPIIIAVVPLVIGAGSFSESLTPVYIALACCAVYLPVLIFFNGVLTAYIQSVWTLTYLRLTKPKVDTPVFVEANA
jgi:membrane-anchored glycerophosphoryl diester phosphodiesterase (GDPDase)